MWRGVRHTHSKIKMKVSHKSFELKGLSNKLIGGQMIKAITRARNRVKEIEVDSDDKGLEKWFGPQMTDEN